MGVAAENRFKAKSLRDFRRDEHLAGVFAGIDRLNAQAKSADAVRYHMPKTELLAVQDPNGKGWWLHEKEQWERHSWGALAFYYDTMIECARDNHCIITGYDEIRNMWMLETL